MRTTEPSDQPATPDSNEDIGGWCGPFVSSLFGGFVSAVAQRHGDRSGIGARWAQRHPSDAELRSYADVMAVAAERLGQLSHCELAEATVTDLAQAGLGDVCDPAISRYGEPWNVPCESCGRTPHPVTDPIITCPAQ